MKFEKNRTIENFAKKVGFIFSYFVFTTILYFLLSLLNKLPQSWNYIYVMGITLGIVLIGLGVKRLLK